MKFQRVLHIVARMDRAGAETMLMNLYREVVRNNLQFDYVYFTNERCEYDDEIEALGGRIIRINASNPVSRTVNLWKVLRKGDWSIVHSHTLFSSGLHLLAAKLAGVPRRVAHSHNTNDANNSTVAGRIYQYSMRRLLAWASTGYVACGKAAADYLFPINANVQIIPNAIAISQFINASGSATRESLGLEKDKTVILQVGRLMPVKNYIFSVRVASALRNSGLDFQMWFVGTGPEQQAVEIQVNQFGLKEHVRILGLREDIPELMAAADVLLMPSLHEGFPVVLVESQAAGLPAVISSTISTEVDLGIGLVEFVDLNASPEEWASRIQAAALGVRTIAEIRLQALEVHGFSAQSGAERLMSVYKTT